MTVIEPLIWPARGGAGGETVIQRFAVQYDYPVWFGAGLFRAANPVLVNTLARLEPGKRHRVVALIDGGLAASCPELAERVARYAAAHAETMELAAAPEVVPGGEAAKNDPGLVEALHRRLLDLRIDRHSYILAVGGGAMLDLVGYVAATFHRGVRLIRVPTTVLAQNDSGIGVKNGVNTFGVKNLTGSFAPPFAVLNDLDFVFTLEDRDKIAGMAESVKVALIRDGVFFGWLEANAEALRRFDREAMAVMIRRGAELHMRQISRGGDPFETGSARPLDYGHWSAHKLESLTGHALRHGEAVAIGVALDTRYAVQTGRLGEVDGARVCQLFERLGFRLWHPVMAETGPDGRLKVFDGLREFREHLGGELTITLLEAIGRGVEVHEIDEAEMRRALDWLEARDEAR